MSDPATIGPDWPADSFALGQWLSGNTAKAFRPTLLDLEEAGYTVVPRDVLGDDGHVIVGRAELAALIDVCKAGYALNGHAADSLRHIEARLTVRLRRRP